MEGGGGGNEVAGIWAGDVLGVFLVVRVCIPASLGHEVCLVFTTVSCFSATTLFYVCRKEKL